jgi:hypothetical protein
MEASRIHQIQQYPTPQESSAIHTLPPDVLRIIFHLCNPRVAVHHGPHLLNPYAIRWPWCLGETCRYWRDIVLETATLWSYINLYRSKTHLDRNLIPRATICLQRSHGSRLTIRFHNSLSRPDECLLLDMLTAHSDRWYDVQLHMPISLLAKLDKIENRVPLLRRLHFSTNSLLSRSSPECTRAFSNAPSLRDVKLELINPISFKINWSQITRYAGVCVLPKSNIFHQATNLVICDTFAYQFPDQPLPPVTLLYLRDLTMSLRSTTNASSLSYLILPALETLDLSIMSQVENMLGSIVELIHRSSCTLKVFRLHGFYRVFPIRLPEEDVTALFKALPSVVDLTIDGIKALLTDAVIGKLTCRSPHDAEPLLPSMQSLSIKAWEKEPFDSTAFVNMLLSRTRGRKLTHEQPSVVPFRRLRIYHRNDAPGPKYPSKMYTFLGSDTTSRLDQLAHHGIEVIYYK